MKSKDDSKQEVAMLFAETLNRFESVIPVTHLQPPMLQHLTPLLLEMISELLKVDITDFDEIAAVLTLMGKLKELLQTFKVASDYLQPIQEKVVLLNFDMFLQNKLVSPVQEANVYELLNVMLVAFEDDLSFSDLVMRTSHKDKLLQMQVNGIRKAVFNMQLENFKSKVQKEVHSNVEPKKTEDLQKSQEDVGLKIDFLQQQVDAIHIKLAVSTKEPKEILLVQQEKPETQDL